MGQPSTEVSDRELADLVLATGDEQAFRSLYRRHTPRAYAMALRALDGASEAAEDVLQEAWLRVVRSLDAFEWRSAFGSWLTSIVLNCARERRRARGRQRSREFPEAGSEPAALGLLHAEDRSPVATSVTRAAERIDLNRALRGLPNGYRTVLMLHDVEGFTHAQIGDMLGISPGTSKSQLHQARRAMRRLLEAGEEEVHA